MIIFNFQNDWRCFVSFFYLEHIKDGTLVWRYGLHVVILSGLQITIELCFCVFLICIYRFSFTNRNNVTVRVIKYGANYYWYWILSNFPLFTSVNFRHNILYLVHFVQHTNNVPSELHKSIPYYVIILLFIESNNNL